jgi:hypothetical protein
MKHLLVATAAATAALVPAVAQGRPAPAYWSQRQANARVLKLIAPSLNPFGTTARRQCAGFRASTTNRHLFRGFSCIVQRKDGSWFTLTLTVRTPTRAVVTSVTCIHYAINTTGRRAC